MSSRIDWKEQLAGYAAMLADSPISVEDFCTLKGLPFGSAKRHLSKKTAMALSGIGEKIGRKAKKAPRKSAKTKTTEPPKKNTTKKSQKSTTENTKTTKKKASPSKLLAGNRNAATTNVTADIHDIDAETVKRGIIRMYESRAGNSLEDTLSILYAQQEHVLTSQENMIASLDHIFGKEDEDKLKPNPKDWDENKTLVQKESNCVNVIAGSLSNLANVISQVEKRHYEIDALRRKVSGYSRQEELLIIREMQEQRIADTLSALDTVRLIENHGITPPPSLMKEAEREISFIEPEEPELDGISDEQALAEQVTFADSLSKKMEDLIGERRKFVDVMTGQTDGFDDEITLNETDFDN